MHRQRIKIGEDTGSMDYASFLGGIRFWTDLDLAKSGPIQSISPYWYKDQYGVTTDWLVWNQATLTCPTLAFNDQATHVRLVQCRQMFNVNFNTKLMWICKVQNKTSWRLSHGPRHRGNTPKYLAYYLTPLSQPSNDSSIPMNTHFIIISSSNTTPCNCGSS